MSNKWSTFRGIAPKLSPKLLGRDMAQAAIDCDVSSGRLAPITEPSLASAIGVSGRKTIYLWRYQEHLLTCGVGEDDYTVYAALTNTAKSKVTIGVVSFEFNPDFTGDTDMDDVAASIQTALRAETDGIENVSWSTDHFLIYANDTIGYLSVPAAGADR